MRRRSGAGLTRMADDSPRHAAQRLVSGFRAFQLVVAACLLELPDLLAAGPLTSGEIAASTGTHPGSMHRMLRGLAVWKVFDEAPGERFTATPLSDQFRSDRPGFRNLAIMLSEEGYESWGDLMHTLLTGQPAFEHLFGKSRWEKLAEDPDAISTFNAAMVETSSRVASAFIKVYDLAGVRTVVDVGGGNGGLLVALLQAHPEVRGVLFDLAQGLAGAESAIAASGVGDRIVLQGGSFFDSAPPDADLYLLKSIVHDWDDERAVAILRTCRGAMRPGARLVLIERRLPERIDRPDEAFNAVMTDLQMMVVLGGRERTVSEYRGLLARAGLRMTRAIQTESEFDALESVIEPG
jgi:SAM-dependent methyltransferase